MWDLIVSVPDHCLSFYFTSHFPFSPSFPAFTYSRVSIRIPFLLKLSLFLNNFWFVIRNDGLSSRFQDICKFSYLALEVEHIVRRLHTMKEFSDPLTYNLYSCTLQDAHFGLTESFIFWNLKVLLTPYHFDVHGLQFVVREVQDIPVCNYCGF